MVLLKWLHTLDKHFKSSSEQSITCYSYKTHAGDNSKFILAQTDRNTFMVVFKIFLLLNWHKSCTNHVIEINRINLQDKIILVNLYFQNHKQRAIKDTRYKVLGNLIFKNIEHVLLIEYHMAVLLLHTVLHTFHGDYTSMGGATQVTMWSHQTTCTNKNWHFDLDVFLISTIAQLNWSS